MKRGVLLVDHGSRRAEANQLIERVAEKLRARCPDDFVAVAHLEIAEPGIAEGVAACVAAGVTELRVHPYFLAPGAHASRDIPERLREAAARHPGLTVSLSEPLGVDEKLVAVVLARLDAARPL